MMLIVIHSTASIELELELEPEPAFIIIMIAKSDSGAMIERQKNVPSEPSNPENFIPHNEAFATPSEKPSLPKWM